MTTRRNKSADPIAALAPQPRKKKKGDEPKKESESHVRLQNLAHLMRIDSIESVAVTKTGHPTSCCSIAEIMAVLFFSPAGMDIDATRPHALDKDRLILSKGHAAPILYSALAWAGFLPHSLLKTLRLKDSILEGHPTPNIPFVDVATGSLGQGLSVGCGMAYSAKFMEKTTSCRFWVILGDGECMEGSVWEAAAFAGKYGLNNLTAIVDINRLGQSAETAYQHNIEGARNRWEGFGWTVFKIDGHSLSEIETVFEKIKKVKDKPCVVLAKTFKGKYIPDVEDKLNWHGTALALDKVQGLKDLLKGDLPVPKESSPEFAKKEPVPQNHIHLANLKCKPGDKIATRKAFGLALLSLHEADKRVVGVDGDVKNSTFTHILGDKFPQALVECYIAEQNMVGMATGMSCRGMIPFVSTFATFFTRAADQLRVLGISQKNVKLVGTHSGVSIGQDGPTQMALQDLSMFRSIFNSQVFLPSDGISAERACELAANHFGIDYIRTARMETPVIYSPQEKFEVGKCKVLLHSDKDQLLIVSGGVTLHESLAAAESLREQGHHVRIIDAFCLKPFDRQGVVQAAKACNSRVLTVEEHYREGGLFELVASELSSEGIPVQGIWVTKLPGSCTPNEQLQRQGLDRASIKAKILELLSKH